MYSLSAADEFTAHLYTSTIGQLDVIAQVAVFLGVVCSVIMGVSRRDGDFIMQLLNIILHAAFYSFGELVMQPRHHDIIAQVPTSITKALSLIDLNAATTTYAVCPTCNCTYEPIFKTGSKVPQYQAICNNRPTPESNECGSSLLHSGDGNSAAAPLIPFVFHHFHDYLASLLSNQDLEGIMDKACDDALNSIDACPPLVTDIWEAEYLRSFDGPKPGLLFIDRKDEGRFCFALNVDGFNVEGMRIRGPTKSCMLISAICLNLPPNLRHNPVYIYVTGIIPKSPSLTQLNHYMKPVVDQILEAWEPGVRFSRTANHPEGRMTRSALVTGVMDLLGARHAAQMAYPTSHHYCSVCDCYGTQTLNRTDHQCWHERDDDELRKHAEEWRNAKSTKEQEAIFSEFGVRWSELWRLPYWTPTRQLVVDPMHNILEGLAQNHFRKVLCLTSAAAAAPLPRARAFDYPFADVDTNESPAGMSANAIKDVSKIHVLLMEPIQGVNENGIVDMLAYEASAALLRTHLQTKNTISLKFVCTDLRLSLPPAAAPGSSKKPVKREFVDLLIKWVCPYIHVHTVTS